MNEKDGFTKNASDSDKSLVCRVRSGDRHALEQLIKRYEKEILRLSFYFMGDTDEAKDVSQEIFIKMCRNLHRYDLSRSFRTWLFTLARRVCISALRKRAFLRRLEKKWLFHQWTQEKLHQRTISSPLDEFADQKRLVSRILELLDQLPTKARVAFILRDVEGLETREVAEIMGVSEITVRRQTQIARRRIKEALDKLGPAKKGLSDAFEVSESSLE